MALGPTETGKTSKLQEDNSCKKVIVEFTKKGGDDAIQYDEYLS